MYRQIIIFLLFYLSGAVLSLAASNIDIGLENKAVFTIEDSAEEDGNRTILNLDQPSKLSGNAGPDQAVTGSDFSLVLSYGFFTSAGQILQSDRAIRHHLYLLFHSILFYDLS